MPVYTVKFPLDVVSKRDTFDVLDENSIEEVVKFNIKSTILTSPGERRGDPDFGVGARSFLFDNELADFGSLRGAILRQIQKYVPYCFVEDLTISTLENNPNALHIKLQYIIPDINKKDVFELILST